MTFSATSYMKIRFNQIKNTGRLKIVFRRPALYD